MSWRTVKLSEVCELINGRAYSQSELLDAGKYPVLRVGNFFTNKNWYYSDLELEDRKYCDFGDLLYAWSASFGPRFWQGDKSIFHYHIWKVEVNPNLIDKRFLYHFFDWDVENIKKESGTGATMIHVSKKSMDARLINLPPLATQQKIVAKLDAIFAEIDKAEAAAEANAKNAEALFQSYLTQVFELGGEGWITTVLNKVCKVDRGSSPRPIKEYFTEGDDGVNWIKIGDTEEGGKYIFSTNQKITKAGAEKSRYVEVGDFILTNSMSYGRPYIMRINGYIHDGWFVLRLNKNIDSEYFFYLLTSPYVQNQFQSLAAGSVVKNISGDLVKKTILPIPPLLEQKRLAEIFSDKQTILKRLSEVYVEKISELNLLKQSILKQAFSGELVKD